MLCVFTSVRLMSDSTPLILHEQPSDHRIVAKSVLLYDQLHNNRRMPLLVGVEVFDHVPRIDFPLGSYRLVENAICTPRCNVIKLVAGLELAEIEECLYDNLLAIQSDALCCGIERKIREHTIVANRWEWLDRMKGGKK